VDLTVLLPAYREAESLRQFLPALKKQLAELTADYQILVVDAGEKIDDTEEVCRDHSVGHVFRRGGNSYGDAMRTGIADAAGHYIVVMDADGSHNPA
jgi:dolichol-phosphate mannosyltransferase